MNFFKDRFPNEYLGDTNLRLAVDVSQMVGIRFWRNDQSLCGEIWRCIQIDSYSSWNSGRLRYMLGVDDHGKEYELAPDPMNEEIQQQLKISW